MADLRTPRSKRVFNSVLKSNTAVALPTIHKTLPSSSPSNNHIKSSYLQIAQNISTNIQYDNKNTLYINRQQDKLKNILKKMNYDTIEMINNIKPHRIQKTKSKQQSTNLTDKEVQNSKKNINNLQYEINKLKEKYTRLINHAEKQDILQQIKITRLEIEAMKQENLEARLSVDKEGKTIVKEINNLQDPITKIIQNDARLGEIRLQKLRSQTNRVQQQTKKISNKIKQFEISAKSLEQDYNNIKAKQQKEIQFKNKETLIRQKNAQIINIKKKTQDKNNMAKHKYYKILRFLEQSVSNTSATESKITEIQKRNKQLKEESTVLETDLKQVKRAKLEKSRLLQDFFQSKQKIPNQQSIQINEFVSVNSTDFLKPQRNKGQFNQLAQEKDLQGDLVVSQKKQNEIGSKFQIRQQKVAEPDKVQPFEQTQISQAIQHPIEIQPKQTIQK